MSPHQPQEHYLNLLHLEETAPGKPRPLRWCSESFFLLGHLGEPLGDETKVLLFVQLDVGVRPDRMDPHPVWQQLCKEPQVFLHLTCQKKQQLSGQTSAPHPQDPPAPTETPATTTTFLPGDIWTL